MAAAGDAAPEARRGLRSWAAMPRHSGHAHWSAHFDCGRRLQGCRGSGRLGPCNTLQIFYPQSAHVARRGASGTGCGAAARVADRARSDAARGPWQLLDESGGGGPRCARQVDALVPAGDRERPRGGGRLSGDSPWQAPRGGRSARRSRVWPLLSWKRSRVFEWGFAAAAAREYGWRRGRRSDAVSRELTMLRAAIELQEADVPLGYCLDTAHCFEAGYDVSTVSGLRETVREMERHIGAEKCAGDPCQRLENPAGIAPRQGTNRSARGYIGADAFERILRHPKLRRKAFILETPTDEAGSQPTECRSLAGVGARSKKFNRRARPAGRRASGSRAASGCW